MNKVTQEDNRKRTGKEKMVLFLLTLILALYALPPWYNYQANVDLGGSWVRSINLAIANNWVFGRDFIFTYGPLGYLSTRFIQHIHVYHLLLSDIFIVIAFFYLFYGFLKKGLQWFIILLIALFYFKGSEFAEISFLLFISYAILNLQHNFSKTIEVIFCAISGAVVFYVKLNYGVVSFPVIFLLTIYQLKYNRKHSHPEFC